jgi:hypothetical protein
VAGGVAVVVAELVGDEVVVPVLTEAEVAGSLEQPDILKINIIPKNTHKISGSNLVLIFSPFKNNVKKYLLTKP